MKRLLPLLLLCLLVQLAEAIPARRSLRAVVQPDGTTLSIQLIGDEHFHYHATADGIPVVQNEQGAYVYAQVKEGRFLPSVTVAHDVALRSADEALLANTFAAQHIAPSTATQARLSQTNARRARRLENAAARSTAYVGNKKGIIILVNYQDKSMVHSRDDFDAQMNQVGYNLNGHLGSLADYFRDQSYGLLNIHFDVVGPYTVSQDLSYYGSNDTYGDDKYPGTLITEAINLAHADGTDFSQYDWDGDGEVDQVFVIYAGYSEANTGAPANLIWPHEWELTSAYAAGNGGNGAITLDGVRIDTYACSSELMGLSGSRQDGIGTAAHEFSHCLGLPDFYDTGGGTGAGMDCWSLMDYGCYNADGNVPAPYTSYERMYSGWLTPIELTDAQFVKDLKPITEAPEAYIIYNGATRNEYYMLENHQQKHSSPDFLPWDKSAYGHGMLVLHVDYSATAWYDNTVNNTKSHQRMTIVPANNKHSYNNTLMQRAGHPFPGTKDVTALTNTTTPAATFFNANTDGKKLLNHAIEDINETNGLISFTFDGGTQLEAPIALPATEIADTAFTANWEAVEGATGYALEVWPLKRDSIATQDLLEENVAETSCRIYGLQPDATYVYRVKAIRGDNESPWSNEVQVDTATGIDALQADRPITASGTLYDLTGRPVAHPTPGIYITNGRKVYIK